MASGDTKTQEYLNLAATGTRADLPAARGCCNTRTQDLIVDVADRIITEEETRAREDAILQGEIDEIKNNPDVFDIVPTYAALQEYDTSTITDKDVIRVLRDETHDNASTYYRWDAADQEFDYIGETGDYYTKAQVDTLLDEKQDELTAGDNITIEDESGALVISATDTTYSNFVGTDGTAAGTAGLVPAPATTDAGKFLKADGTWDTAGGGGGPTVVQTTGTSTTDVMSQNAVSSMIYADPSTKSRVQIGNNGATGSYGVAIGNTAISSGSYSTALGCQATAYGSNSIAAGYAAAGNGDGAVAVGFRAGTVSGIAKKGSVSIGAYAKAAEPGEVSIGSTDTNYGYNNSNYRLLTGLYDPQSAHDAATKGYVDSHSGGAPLTDTQFNTLWEEA